MKGVGTMVAGMSLVVLMLLLPPPEGSSAAGFVHGFGPIDPGIVASFHDHTTIVANTLADQSLISDVPATMVAAASLSLEKFPVVPGTDAASFGFDKPSAALTPAELWSLRIGSGILTYLGFVFATDRPRGQLGVPLVDDESGNNIDGFMRVGSSTVPGAGLGLFAARSMPKGTVLGTYPGVVLPLGQHSASSKVKDYPGCASYIWRFTDNKYVIDPTDHRDGTLSAVCRGGNPSQPLSVVFFDLLSIFGMGVPTALCRINEPPKGRDVNVVTEEDLESRTVTFTLERDVFAGEEFHLDYGLTYDRTGYGNAGGGSGL